MRLMGPPPLTYQPENHIPMDESISFQFFLILSFSLIFRFNVFFAMKMLGFCCGMCLDENLTS